jgi:TolA-binding protein
VIEMFNYIKGLFNKKEIARIKELEQENNELRKELEELNERAIELHMELKYKQERAELEERGTWN